MRPGQREDPRTGGELLVAEEPGRLGAGRRDQLRIHGDRSLLPGIVPRAACWPGRGAAGELPVLGEQLAEPLLVH